MDIREPLDEPNAACVVRACRASRESRFGLCRRGDQSAFKTDPTSATSTRVLARNHERERPVLSSRTKATDRDLRGFAGWDARSKGAAALRPLWSRRRRSPQLVGLNPGPRRHRRRCRSQDHDVIGDEDHNVRGEEAEALTENNGFTGEPQQADCQSVTAFSRHGPITSDSTAPSGVCNSRRRSLCQRELNSLSRLTPPAHHVTTHCVFSSPRRSE